jgi:membrane fusion protein (multidrug efflux system)
MIKAATRPAVAHAGRGRAFGALAIALLAAACGQQESTPVAAPPPPAVTVVQVKPQDVTTSVQFLGRVVAIDKVDLRARVQGFLEQRLFTEGDNVKKGELLFVIEQPPFRAKVDQADAGVARAEASLAEADATLSRVQQAVKSGAVSKQDLDQAVAGKDVAQAQVKSAEAQLEIAKLDLDYTEIKAPINGRIGRANYTVGNLVGPDSGVLATIVSQNPIYVTFPVSQRQLLEYRTERGDAGSSVVRVTLPNGKLYDQPGKLNFLDVQVDPGTDTVTVRAELPNPERTLVDGQFVNVRVESGKPEQVLAVPQAALQVDQAGPYVLVIDGADKVEARRVKLGQTEGTQTVIQEGLKEGERVIVEGIQKVRPGMVVAATEAPPAIPAAQNAGAPAEGAHQ